MCRFRFGKLFWNVIFVTKLIFRSAKILKYVAWFLNKIYLNSLVCQNQLENLSKEIFIDTITLLLILRQLFLARHTSFPQSDE